jgi:hypothetical protein
MTPGFLFGIALITACSLNWLEDTSGKRAEFVTYERCQSFANYIRNRTGQEGKCLPLPRSE